MSRSRRQRRGGNGGFAEVRKAARRILRQFPAALAEELGDELEGGGRHIQTEMRVRAGSIRKTGATDRAIRFRVLKRSLRLRVGLIGTPAERLRQFYSRIQDLGRKAQTVFVQRRRKGAPKRLRRGRKIAADIGATYRMKVRAMAPKRFVSGRFTDARKRLRLRLNRAYTRAMRKVAG